MTTYVVMTRNPATGKLLILKDEDEDPVEFKTEEDAEEAAESNTCCLAWGAEIVPVDH